MNAGATLRVWWLVVTACLVPCAAIAETPRVLPPEASGFFQGLLAPSELTRSLDIEIRRDHAVYRFRRGAAVAEIEVRDASTCASPAGVLCLQPGAAHGPDSAALAAEARDALDRAARATGAPSPWLAEPDAVDVARPGILPPPRPPRQAPAWLVAGEAFFGLVLVGVILAAWRGRRLFASRAAMAPAALFLGALAVRLAAHPITADIRSVLDAGVFLEARRAGWSSYLHLLFLALPAKYETVWAVHRVLGALAAPLLYAVMRRRFSATAAIAGATALAALPMAARFAASDTPYVPLCAAFLGAIVALDAFAASGSRGALTLGLGLLTCAMQLRPDGPWLVVPALLLFLSHPTDRRSLTRPSVLLLVACFLCLNLPFSWWALVGHRSEGEAGPSDLLNFRGVGALIDSPWRDLSISPWPLTLLVVAGAWIATRSGRPGVLWLVATAVAFPLHKQAIAQLANARHHLLPAHLACGLAGLAVAALLDRWARRRGVPLSHHAAVALSALIPIAAALPRVDVLTRMWTPQLEFEHFRAALRQLGEDCAVVSFVNTADAGFRPSTDPGIVELVDVEDFFASPPPRACFVYYRAANCFSPDASSRAAPSLVVDWCGPFEEKMALSPIAEWTLPAIPYRGERYSRDPLPVGLYRIKRP